MIGVLINEWYRYIVRPRCYYGFLLDREADIEVRDDARWDLTPLALFWGDVAIGQVAYSK
ncbi:MAG: hypothetical protein ACX93T_04210 [Bacteroidota bacterium]